MAEAERHNERTKTVLQCLEVILQIWRSGGYLYVDHGATAHPPSLFIAKLKHIYNSLSDRFCSLMWERMDGMTSPL